MKRQEIAVAAGTLEATQAGPIVSLSFSGYYPPGSMGNEPWAKARDQAERLIADFSPAALLFDLTDLDYVWGDSIAGLFCLIYKNKKQRPKAACLVARGRTAVALKTLLESLHLPVDVPMFETTEDGIAFLRRSLAQPTRAAPTS